MAKSITWPDLLSVYQNATWRQDGTADVFVASESIRATFALVESSDRAEYDADIAALVDPKSIAVGQTISVRIGSPKLQLGILAEDWDAVIAAPEGRISERQNYFVKADGSHSGTVPPPAPMTRYRKMLEFVAVLRKAALFLDPQRQTLVFYKDIRVEVPVRFSAGDLKSLDVDGVESLQVSLSGDVHTDQRLAILTDAVLALATGQSPEGRFLYLAQNAGELSSRVHEGYKLFASSFSYSKIRNEIEAAQSEYVNRIHKTFSDIQGQLLGLPVASVVVATQLKAVAACGPEAWANLAVTGGAWLFAALLVGSCINQWYTLNAINGDIDRQKTKLNRDFSEITPLFSDAFRSLGERLFWHRTVLLAICAVAIAGAGFASFVFRIATPIDVLACR